MEIGRKVVNFHKGILTFIILLFLPVFILCSALSSLWRKILLIVVKKWHPQVTSLVHPRSMAFGVDSLYSSPKCAILISCQIEGSFDMQDVKTKGKLRILDATLPNGSLQYPELNQHIRTLYGYLFWQKNATPFDIDDIIIPVDYTTDADLQKLKACLLKTPFTKDKPMLSIHLVRNFEMDKRKTLFLARFHHVIGDGQSVMHLLLVQLFQFEMPGVEGKYLVYQRTGSWVDTVKYITQLPFRFSDELATCVQNSFKRMHFKVLEKKQSGVFYTMECEKVSVSKVKAISKAFDVSFTSVLVSVITAVLREVLIARGCRQQELEELPCLLPIPIPLHLQRLRNYMTGAWTLLPIGESLPLNRLYKCDDEIKRIKESTFPYAMVGVSKLIGSCPSRIVKLMARNSFAPVGISNLPGPRQSMYYKGAKLTDGFYSAGLQNGVTGIVFCISTYLDNLVVSSSGLAEAVTTEEFHFLRRRIPLIFDEYFQLIS